MRCCFVIAGVVAIAVTLSAANPKQSERAFRDGLRHEQGGRWAEAEKAYSEALQYDPGNAEAYLHRARVRLHNNDFQHAVDDASALINLQPGSGEAYQLRGDIYRKMPDNAKSLSDYNR